jgi:hypothetical protein
LYAEEAAVTRRSKDIDDDGIDGLRNNWDWPTATTRLFDALQTYISVSEKLLREFPNSTEITQERIDRRRALLREIEPHQVDPSLNQMLNPYE